MRLTLLGTGGPTAAPVYGCPCPACRRAQGSPHYRRLPASALLQTKSLSILIDAGLTDLEERFPPGTLDAIFLTHFHVDHVQGLFPLRWGVAEKLSVFCPNDPEGCADLYKNPGLLRFEKSCEPYKTIIVGDLKITPLPLIHSKVTWGYLFTHERHDIAYLTDTKGLPDKTMEYLRGQHIDLLVLDCSTPPHITVPNHNNIDEALSIHHQIAPAKTVMTHITHQLDLWLMETEHQLPETFHVGLDNVDFSY